MLNTVFRKQNDLYVHKLLQQLNIKIINLHVFIIDIFERKKKGIKFINILNINLLN